MSTPVLVLNLAVNGSYPLEEFLKNVKNDKTACKILRDLCVEAKKRQKILVIGVLESIQDKTLVGFQDIQKVSRNKKEISAVVAKITWLLLQENTAALTKFQKNAQAELKKIYERMIKAMQEQMPEHTQDIIDKKFLEQFLIRDFKLDGLDTVELLMALEQEFDLDIPDEETEKTKILYHTEDKHKYDTQVAEILYLMCKHTKWLGKYSTIL